MSPDNQGRWVSPDDEMAAAELHMLNGREPVSNRDWENVINFAAFNFPAEYAEAICQILRAIYSIPLSPEVITEIAAFQIQRRKETKTT